ncbi:MAG: DJ-1/PfpI family protein [Planctomycetes bacterium]|nr:DJ-1/PfpI family protein [Planctomycetota bacterium]
MNILIPLAEGFEEIEAVTVIDVLRRGGLDVLVAGVGAREIKGAHGLIIMADVEIGQTVQNKFAGIFLPGGLPGSENLLHCQELRAMLLSQHKEDRWLGAICAAPMVLGDLGILAGRRATCYPGFEDKLGGAIFSEDRVVVDGTIITARGAGVSLEFSFRILDALGFTIAANKLRKGMLADASAG